MPHRILFAALLGFFACNSALANDRRYDVEIVVLENTDTSAGEAERWKAEVTMPDVEGAIALEGPVELAPMVRSDLLAETPEGFEPLPSDRRKLGGAIRKLQESGRYRVLRHLAWQQPALNEEAAPRVRIHNGEAMTVRVPIRDFEELYALEDAPADEGNDRQAEGAASTGTPESRVFEVRAQPLLRPVEIHPLDGTVRLVVSRYLHVYTDLYFTAPVDWTDLPVAPEAESDTDAEQANADSTSTGEDSKTTGLDTTMIARGPNGRAMLSYPFAQHRRMRSGELHYLDHPVLGMLIRVDRAEEAGEDDIESGAEEPSTQSE